MVQKANLQKAVEIHQYMERDFSENEIPDYQRYLKLTKENIHNVYVYKENGQEVAYFITIEKEEKVLITHLAVIEDYRGKGMGKRLLEAIKTFLGNKKMLMVEVETEKNAKNEQELTIIERRIRYYLKAGFRKCEGIEYRLFDMDYYILIYSTFINEISDKEVKQTIEAIYGGLFPKKNLIINEIENQIKFNFAIDIIGTFFEKQIDKSMYARENSLEDIKETI